MKIKQLIDEDFVNYKYPSMFIGTSYCTWKCCKEQNIDISICQNSALAESPVIDASDDYLIKRYKNNPITKSIVIGGLEPILQFDELLSFIANVRESGIMDDIVIYTGYYENEINNEIRILEKFTNVVIKFGRYIPNNQKHFDEVLQVYLASDNQYAKRIS